jgi:hypothetical protein
VRLWTPSTRTMLSVGAQNIVDNFGHHGQASGGVCSEKGPECWRCNAAEKFTAQQPGMWFSTLDIGYCVSHPEKNCSWRVLSVEKRVSLACRNDVFFSAVENVNTTCFDACPQPYQAEAELVRSLLDWLLLRGSPWTRCRQTCESRRQRDRFGSWYTSRLSRCNVGEGL